MNRVAIVMSPEGNIEQICSDEPIDILIIDPAQPHDKVYKFASVDIGPEHVHAHVNGHAVGHTDDHRRPHLPPSRPHLRVVDNLGVGNAVLSWLAEKEDYISPTIAAELRAIIALEAQDEQQPQTEAPRPPENVVYVNAITSLDMDPDRVLAGAQEQEFQGVVVLGFLADEGGFYGASSFADGATVNWLLDAAKFEMFKAWMGGDE